MDVKNRLLELGFFPVSLDFSENDWQLVEKAIGERRDPALCWLRQVPVVGDSIVFQIDNQHFRGKVVERAFEATNAQALFDKEAEIDDAFAHLFLYLDSLQAIPHPADASIWGEEVEP